jgi:hypothetical protein
VGFFSDRETGGPWTVIAQVNPTLPFSDYAGVAIDNGTVTVQIDHPSGQNGEKAYVTVTPTKAGRVGFQLVTLKSTLVPNADATTHPSHYLPILIANQ